MFLPSNKRRHCMRIGLRRRRMVPVGRRPGDAGEDSRPLRPPRHPEGEHPGICLCVENMSGWFPLFFRLSSRIRTTRFGRERLLPLPLRPHFYLREKGIIQVSGFIRACERGVFQVFFLDPSLDYQMYGFCSPSTTHGVETGGSSSLSIWEMHLSSSFQCRWSCRCACFFFLPFPFWW